MTIHSGGPHILLFERDQQLTGLLLNELQLAGYECHAARTAVEVFDVIARFPVRLVLVNLAQAAAGRREFWVALDAQRRGRGVQVFTFRCMNIAGYGEDDPDERTRIVLTDMEVDGTLGLMRLVDAVRVRIPIAPAPSVTGSFARVGATTPDRDSARLEAIRLASQPGFSAAPLPLAAQPSMQSGVPFSALNASPSASAPANPPVIPPPPTLAQQQAVNSSITEQAALPRIGTQPSTFTDKIRAVIGQGNRGYSPIPSASLVPNAAPPLAPQRPGHPDGVDTTLRPTNGEIASPIMDSVSLRQQRGEETGLARLSRLAQTPASNDLILRASPIEDVPVERLPERRNGMTAPTGTAGGATAEDTPDVITPTLQLASITLPPTTNRGDNQEAPTARMIETKQPDTSNQTNVRSILQQRDELIDAILIEQRETDKHGEQDEQSMPEIARAAESIQAIQTTQTVQTPDVPGISEMLTTAALRRRSEHSVTSEDVLLNIVQSLPPMNALPAPVAPNSPQAAVLSGRATRSLANVLIDGHLVPKDRLEVAQSIQRMLRGVDMNYQLGEILLMFKLLTPDQLLAASLVSYGMISAAQISSLGRIRQELHSMSLEYDLESLLVLFRMLTPEQLREVRSSWTG